MMKRTRQRRTAARGERSVFKSPDQYRQNHRVRPRVAGFVAGCMNSRFMNINVDVAGLDNIPKTGSVLVAPDHHSFYDGFLNGLMMEDGLFAEEVRGDREVYFAAKSEIWTMGPARIPGRYFGAIVEPLGAVPVDRNGGGMDRFIRDFSYLLEHPRSEEGAIVIAYPGGTRIKSTTQPERVRSGVTVVSRETGTPVVPVGQVNTDRIAREMWNPLKETNIAARVGQPIYPEQFQGEGAVMDQNLFTLESIRGLSRQAAEAVR